jgi:hypothetical protein
MPAREISNREHFKVDLSEWRFDYGFHVNADAGPRDPLGVCWEGHYVILKGPLRSKTKRKKCLGVKLTLSPRPIVPKDWDPCRKGFGSIQGVRGGWLTGQAVLPTESFHSLLTALTAGKVQRFYVSIRDVERGAGVIDSFFTLDPTDDDDHE